MLSFALHSQVKEAYDCLLQLFKELGDSTLLEDSMDDDITHDGDEESRNDLMEEDSEEKHMSASLQKPFGSYFVKQLQAINVCVNAKLPVNPRYISATFYGKIAQELAVVNSLLEWHFKRLIFTFIFSIIIIMM